MDTLYIDHSILMDAQNQNHLLVQPKFRSKEQQQKTNQIRETMNKDSNDIYKLMRKQVHTKRTCMIPLCIESKKQSEH